MLPPMNAELVILVLKVAVVAVTVLLACSLVALARGHFRWHGRINTVFAALTLTALLGLEVIARIIDPTLFDDYLERHEARAALRTHLAFALPAAALLLLMLATGWTHRRTLHITLGIVFVLLWIGTFITGVFFLPHRLP